MKAWNLVLAVTAHPDPRFVELQQQDIRILRGVVERMKLPTTATLVLGVHEVALREGAVPKQERADLQGHIKKVCRNSSLTIVATAIREGGLPCTTCPFGTGRPRGEAC
jgi:hypothetical protein